MASLASLALLGVMAGALVGLLVAERQRAPLGLWATKPVASAAFVALAFVGGLPRATPEAWLALAIALAFAGDLLLIPRGARAFRAGILVFLLAHVAFIGAFVATGPSWAWALLSLAPLGAVAALVARWLLPRVAAPLKGAVVAYMAVITAMVAVAAGAAAAGASAWLLVGALGFYANDLLVARDRFVRQAWWHRAAGLPLYYGAMALFALTASGSLA